MLRDAPTTECLLERIRAARAREQAMRGLMAGCLVLFLGPWAADGRAGDPSPNVVVVPNTNSAMDPADGKLAPAGLGRPIAYSLSPSKIPSNQSITELKLAPVSFGEINIGVPRTIVRAQSADSPQPMPMGPAVLIDSPADKVPANKPVVLTQKPEVLSIVPRTVDGIDQVVPPGSYVVGGGDQYTAADSSECPDACCWGLGWLRCWMPLRRLGCFILSDGCCVNEPCRIWFEGDYLLWWTRKSSVPPLVTFSPPGTPPAIAGIVGLNTTTVLIGDGSPIDNQDRNGARFTLGFWLDCERELALESTTFFLGDRQFAFAASGTAAPGSFFLARPFINVTTGVPVADREPVAFPNLSSGTVAVTASSSLWGTELNLRTNLSRQCCSRLDLLTGFRFLGLDESVHITENVQVVPEFGGTQFNIFDTFGTHNNFYGGQLGLDWEWRRGRWTFDLLGKVALGDTHEVVIIDGGTAMTSPGMATVSQPGGILALASTNIGHFNRDSFTVVPEAGVKLGYQIRPHIKLTVGYTFLYWSEVARAGDQIDQSVNITRIPFSGVAPTPPLRPAFVGKTTDYWAQGISLGLEFKY
jgi:hypothetical protein